MSLICKQDGETAPFSQPHFQPYQNLREKTNEFYRTVSDEEKEVL